MTSLHAHRNEQLVHGKETATKGERRGQKKNYQMRTLTGRRVGWQIGAKHSELWGRDDYKLAATRWEGSDPGADQLIDETLGHLTHETHTVQIARAHVSTRAPFA